MNFKLSNLVAATLAGSMLMGFGANAMADSTTDIVNALVAKGVLTEEEGALLTKGRTDEAAGQAKAIKKAGKLTISDAVDSATVYGDIRVRHETRSATTNETGNKDYERNRERYKITLGVKTDADNGRWYSDLALAMGTEGRSDNATFGGASTVTNGNAPKEALFVKRAMVGFKATDWLALEAGRISNPLYTTQMVWDADLTFDGAAAKMNFKQGESKFFVTGAATQYRGDDKQYSTGSNQSANNVFMAQAGFDTPLTNEAKAKAAITFYKYGSTNNTGGIFKPTLAANGALGGNVIGTNNLDIIEVPAELSYKLSDVNSIKVFGDWVINTDANGRATAAGDTSSAKDDDTAWLLGMEYKNQAGKKAAAGDYNAKIWYQETGLYALDPNAVDSDFFDSKINVKGTVFKAEYLAADNVYVNFAYGHGTRKNSAAQTAGVAGDTGFNLKDFDLLQLDLTYKF